MSVTGESDGSPVKAGVPVGDFGAGLYGAFCVTAAILQAKQTGCGAFIDCSMLAGLLGIAALQTSEYFGTGSDPRKLGSAHPRNAPYQAFSAKDGYFAMAAGNDGLWRAACDAIGLPGLAADPRFASTTLRATHQGDLKAILEAEFSRFTAAELLEKFRAAGVPCAPINTYSKALDDVQVKHMQWVREITLPGGAKTRTFASPLRFSGKGFPIYRDPPALGEHDDEVFGGNGAAAP
jgi:crotonobetainyl-CoA:carnitine CoA-transferase CaiB-like acyl-CoA transferase